MITALLGFWTVSFSLTCTPGLDWAYVMSAGIKRQVLPALCGMLLGYLAVIVLVATGLGVMIASYPPVLSLLTVIGAVYLIWMGVQILRSPATIDEGHIQEQSAKQWLIKGIAVSGLNPKVLLMFLAIVPQFLTTQAGWSMANQTLFLGLIHIVNCALIYPMVGIGAGFALRCRPRLSTVISRVSGVLMILIALSMLIKQVMESLASG